MLFYTVESLHDLVDFLSNSHLLRLRLSILQMRTKWSFASSWPFGAAIRLFST